MSKSKKKVRNIRTQFTGGVLPYQFHAYDEDASAYLYQGNAGTLEYIQEWGVVHRYTHVDDEKIPASIYRLVEENRKTNVYYYADWVCDDMECHEIDSE